MSTPFALCQLCCGPIWSGEPVSAHLDGWIHRFKSTCDAVKEDRAAEEEKRLLAGPKQ